MIVSKHYSLSKYSSALLPASASSSSFRRDPPPPVPSLAGALRVTLGIRLPILRPGLDPPLHFTRLQKLRGAMDPNTKLLLDEMKRLGERFTSLETRVDGLGSRL
jgi:hypothetical protein